MTLKNPRTSPAKHSIWSELTEDTFRQHLVSLEERTNAVPVDPQVFNVSEWESRCLKQRHTLPIAVEQQLADDFARLVAVNEGAQSVAAVCIEEAVEDPGLILRFAALDISLNDAIRTTLETTSDVLARVASKPMNGIDEARSEILQVVMELHYLRLLARLRSAKWIKPKYLSKSHKKPLWQDFTNLQHRVGFLYSRKEKSVRTQVEELIIQLGEVLQNFEKADVSEQFTNMIALINASFAFTHNADIKNFGDRIENSVKTVPTPQVASAIKCLRQIQKIAAYRRICDDMIEIARKYGPLFQAGLTFEYLEPYEGVGTSIGYESWAKTCHIHAEVQLVIFYDICIQQVQHPRYLQPRCIGISKWLCYLCFRFLQAHGQFFPSKTHGRLYDQWTLPDLDEFQGPLVTRYRLLLRELDDIVVKQAENEPELWRVEPMTSVDLVHTGSEENTISS